MFERLRQRTRDEHGATIVFVAVVMIVILGMAALVVDVGSWFNTRREAQNAADAAALAGVQDLPGSASTAVNDAVSYGQTNYSGATTSATSPYNGDGGEIKVTVTKNVPSIFGGIFGIVSLDV